MQSELNKIEPFTPSQEGEGEEIAVISSKEVDKIFSALARGVFLRTAYLRLKNLFCDFMQRSYHNKRLLSL